MKALLERRSIRTYTAQAIPEDVIKEVITAAMCAPSAGNEQPWHFVVINERKILDEVPTFHKHAGMVKKAPLAILVCADLEKEVHKGFWVQDCSAAVENLLIAIADKGLGAVWTGLYPREDRVEGMRRLLGIPEHIVPFALIPVGYSNDKNRPVDRFDASRIHYNKW
jgi:nitroreductase